MVWCVIQVNVLGFLLGIKQAEKSESEYEVEEGSTTSLESEEEEDDDEVTTSSGKQRIVPVQKPFYNYNFCSQCPDPMLIVQSAKKLRFGCGKCKAQFHCLNHLKIHEQIHDFKYSCSVCGFRFASALNEDVHYRFKHASTKFYCRNCDCHFRDTKTYDSHWQSCYDKSKT